MRIKRVAPLSLGKMMGGLNGLMGLLFGGIVSVASLFGAMGAALGEEAGGAIVGLIFGVGAVIIMPLFYGFMGFVMGLITALIYNLVAGLFGGIEIEVE